MAASASAFGSNNLGSGPRRPPENEEETKKNRGGNFNNTGNTGNFAEVGGDPLSDLDGN